MSAAESINKRHVLVLAKWYPNRRDPQLGVFIQKHVKALAIHHRVTVFVAMSDPLKTDRRIEHAEHNAGNISEHLFYYKPSKGALAQLRNAWTYYRCWRLFKRKTSVFNGKSDQPDALLAYILLRTACIAWWESKQHHIPYYVSEQWSGFATGKAYTQPWHWKIISKYLLKQAAGVGAVSNFLKSKIETYCGRSDISVIHNIIEPELKEAVEVSDGKIKVLMVADLVDEIKNISSVISVFSKLVTDFPTAELHIIGDGPDRKKLISLANDKGLLGRKIHFEGRLPNTLVYQWLQKSSFLIMNSRYETFSLICAEALVCGKPVVATACGGPQEFITPDVGLLIPPDDDVQLEISLRKMLCSYTDYDSVKLMTYARSNFGIEGAGQEFAAWLGGR